MLKRTLHFLVAGLITAWSGSAWSQQVKEIPWGTSAVGSAGHKALVAMADVLNREMPNYRITVQPTGGAIVSVKGYATGQFEGYYGADIAFWELANDSHRFKGFKKEMKRQPVQSFWTYSLEVGTAVHSRNKDRYKSWRDLSGKPVFTGPLPWDVRAQLERAYEALGVKHNYRQVDLTAAGSLLQGGGIEAFIVYTTSEATPPGWITEASLATDWAVLNPSADELAALKKAGFVIAEVSPTAFKRDIHADKAVLLPFYYGFHVGLEVPENDVYRMLTVIEKNAAELAKVDASFAQIAKDMPGMQRRGVETSADLVPIHPGLARYMREKGVWDKKWDARVAKK
jgi:uncharacterized protein